MISQLSELVIQSLTDNWCTASEIAAKANVRASSVGTILKILAKKGCVKHRWNTTQRMYKGISRVQEYRIN